MEQGVTVMGSRSTEVQRYDHNENVASIKRDIEEIRRANAEYAVRVGRKLVLAKENVDHGLWLETLDELNFTSQTASNLMRIAETFGDNPDMLIGMSQRRALLLVGLPEENLVQTKQDGLIYFPDGSTCTLTDYIEMREKDVEARMLLLRNQKNKENREYKDKASNLQSELSALQRQAEEDHQFLQDLMKNKDSAFADRVNKLAEIIKLREEKIRDLEVKIIKLDQEESTEDQVREAIEDAKSAIDQVYLLANNLKLTADKVKMRADLVAFIHWAQESITIHALGNKLEKEYSDGNSENS